jgi:hypothetical protein
VAALPPEPVVALLLVDVVVVVEVESPVLPVVSLEDGESQAPRSVMPIGMERTTERIHVWRISPPRR